MGYREPDVVLELDVDVVGVQLPHRCVASAATDGILGYSDNAKAGVKAWQRTEGTHQWMLKESLAVVTAIWRALPGVDTTLAIACWISRASKHRDRNRLRKVAMQMGFYLAEVNPWNCNLSRPAVGNTLPRTSPQCCQRWLTSGQATPTPGALRQSQPPCPRCRPRGPPPRRSEDLREASRHCRSQPAPAHPQLVLIAAHLIQTAALAAD